MLELEKKFFKDLSWTVLGIGLALGIDYLYYLFAGRLLGPEEFGIFGVVMSLYYVTVRSPFRALEITSRKMESEDENAVAQLGRKTVAAGFAVWMVFLAASGPIARLLQVPVDVLRLFSLVFPAAYLLPVLIGKLEGRERFSEYASYEVFGSLAAFTALGLVILGLGVKGAVMAPALEMVGGIILVLYFLRPRLGKRAFRRWRFLLRSAVFIFVIQAAFSLDIILLQIFKPARTVGLYNAVAVLGKAIFFGAIAVNRSVFPKFVKNGDSRWKLLHLSLVVLLLGGLFGTAFFSLVGERFIALTFGASYSAAASFAPLYMIFISGVAAVALLGNYYLSLDRNIWTILLLPLVQVPGIVLFHETVNQVIGVGIVAVLVTFAVLYLPELKTGYVGKEV